MIGWWLGRAAVGLSTFGLIGGLAQPRPAFGNPDAKVPELAVAGAVLYETGLDTSGLPISGRGGADGRFVMRGGGIACANCHGLNATGGGEGYVRAPSLLWPEWASANVELRASARARLDAALRHGQGQDRQLSPAMPRFDIDDQTVDAIALHLTDLVSRAPVARVPTFAMLRLNDSQAPQIELALHHELSKCLRRSFGDRVKIDMRDAGSAADAQRVWADWVARGEVVAVLAPPWRQRAPTAEPDSSAAAAVRSLPVLFPLTPDPEPNAPSTTWLFGGEHARSVALIQAWFANPASSDQIPVWAGPGPAGDNRWASLGSVADVVYRGTGRRPQWQRLRAPSGRAEIPALWLDPASPPSAGWWLSPHAPPRRPAWQARLWTAQPYAGRTMRPLAERWADATCRTVDALLAREPSLTRSRWGAALTSLGRLDDGNGWDWRPTTADVEGHGAADGWTIVEFAAGDLRLVALRVDIARGAAPSP